MKEYFCKNSIGQVHFFPNRITHCISEVSLPPFTSSVKRFFLCWNIDRSDTTCGCPNSLLLVGISSTGVHQNHSWTSSMTPEPSCGKNLSPKIDLSGLRSQVQVSGTPWPETWTETWTWDLRPGPDLLFSVTTDLRPARSTLLHLTSRL